MDNQNLNECPQIVELLTVLEQSGLQKEKAEVQSLVDYIGSMENKTAQMLEEIQGMREEVAKLHDRGLRAKCTQVISIAETKVQTVKTGISTLKRNLVLSAENAVKVFREKGSAALVKAVNAMHIPSVLSHLKGAFQQAAQTMQDNASKVDTIREELHEAGTHIQNAGRSLFGKSPKQAEQLAADKGVLAKVRGLFESLNRSFTGMERSADNLLTKIQGSKDRAVEKPSVKSDLRQLKSKQTSAMKTPAVTEQAR